MNNYREEIQALINSKTGNSNVFEMEFFQLDSKVSRERFNIDCVIGNINLVQGRFKTTKEADEEVIDFLNTPIPELIV